jgi:hypothetical protein
MSMSRYSIETVSLVHLYDRLFLIDFGSRNGRLAHMRPTADERGAYVITGLINASSRGADSAVPGRVCQPFRRVCTAVWRRKAQQPLLYSHPSPIPATAIVLRAPDCPQCLSFTTARHCFEMSSVFYCERRAWLAFAKATHEYRSGNRNCAVYSGICSLRT